MHKFYVVLIKIRFLDGCQNRNLYDKVKGAQVVRFVGYLSQSAKWKFFKKLIILHFTS